MVRMAVMLPVTSTTLRGCYGPLSAPQGRSAPEGVSRDEMRRSLSCYPMR